jgi:hypothetical protein
MGLDLACSQFMLRELRNGNRDRFGQALGIYIDTMETSSVCRSFLEINGIQTVAQAARWWSVPEYVAQVRVAGVADGFYPFQAGPSKR